MWHYLLLRISLDLQRVRALARAYHPFGEYHLITGSVVRSLPLPQSTRGVTGRLGDADYADRVQEQLDVKRIWKNLYGAKGK